MCSDAKLRWLVPFVNEDEELGWDNESVGDTQGEEREEVVVGGGGGRGGRGEDEWE